MADPAGLRSDAEQGLGQASEIVLVAGVDDPDASEVDRCRLVGGEHDGPELVQLGLLDHVEGHGGVVDVVPGLGLDDGRCDRSEADAHPVDRLGAEPVGDGLHEPVVVQRGLDLETPLGLLEAVEGAQRGRPDEGVMPVLEHELRCPHPQRPLERPSSEPLVEGPFPPVVDPGELVEGDRDARQGQT